MKIIKLMAVSAVLLSNSAFADTYNANVHVQNLARSLTWAETTQMVFPDVVLSSSVKGDQCIIGASYYQDKKKYTKLCPGDQSVGTGAVFTVSGLPNATVMAVATTPAQIVEGIEFDLLNAGPQGKVFSNTAVVLDETGKADFNVGGALTLVDPAANVSDDLTFTYELEFAAQ